MRNVLILGGSSEGHALADKLSAHNDLALTSSLAGRVSNPKTLPGRTRVGGFGGVEGLVAYLQSEQIEAVLDATHPFATQISSNARQACATVGIPLIPLTRAAWTPAPQDLWHQVPTLAEAAAWLLPRQERVFLTTGRQDLPLFASNTRSWFLIRTIDHPDPPLPQHHELLLDRGPFTYPNELAILKSHRISILVTKNSGGPAAFPKLEAARELGIPVLMVTPPAKHPGPAAQSIEQAVALLLKALNP